MLSLINRWLWVCIDWVFPPSCAGCGIPGTRLCPKCLANIRRIKPPICKICGEKLSNGNICTRCRFTPPKITAIRSWAVYEDTVRKGLHQLKYSRNIALGDTFSVYLCNLLLDTGWHIDVIAPIPLGNVRQKERGYNQAALLAKPVARQLKIPYQPKIVRRTRETISQVTLTLADRKTNVAGAFKAKQELVNGKNVLIIDDITTSGSTLEACAEALFSAGAKNVYGMTVARAG